MNNFGEKVSFIWSVADLLRKPCGLRHFSRTRIEFMWENKYYENDNPTR